MKNMICLYMNRLQISNFKNIYLVRLFDKYKHGESVRQSVYNIIVVQLDVF